MNATEEKLLAELEDTAEWIEGRAGILEQLKLRGDVADQVRAEVARYRGRVALIRLTISSAKGGRS